MSESESTSVDQENRPSKEAVERRFNSFSLTDLLNAQDAPDHFIHSLIKKSGDDFCISRTEQPDGSALFSMPFMVFVEYLAADWIASRGIDNLSNLISLASEPKTKKEKAYMELFLGYEANYTHQDHVKAGNHFFAAAKAGHFSAQTHFIANWTYSPEFEPRMNKDIAETWLKRGIDVGFPYPKSLRVNLSWARKRGIFELSPEYNKSIIFAPDLPTRKLILGDCKIMANYTPVSELIAYRDRLADMIGAFRCSQLKNLTEDQAEKIPELNSFLSVFRHPFEIWNQMEYLTAEIRIHGRSPQIGDIFSIDLDLSSTNDVDNFFKNLNSVIDFEHSYDDIKRAVDRVMRFDDEAPSIDDL